MSALKNQGHWTDLCLKCLTQAWYSDVLKYICSMMFLNMMTEVPSGTSLTYHPCDWRDIEWFCQGNDSFDTIPSKPL